MNMTEAKNHSITLKESRDLIEIEAQYFQNFTAMADDDALELLTYLSAYLQARKSILPDVALSITYNAKCIVKGIALTYEDIQSCQINIEQQDLWIVATLARKALLRSLQEMNTVDAITLNIQQHLLELSNLQDAICGEHNESLPQQHSLEVR